MNDFCDPLYCQGTGRFKVMYLSLHKTALPYKRKDVWPDETSQTGIVRTRYHWYPSTEHK